MKKIYKLLVLFSFLGLMSFTKEDCDSKLKNNRFTYRVAKENVLVVFKEKQYIEYHQKRKYYIKSDIEWVSSCEYNLTIRESTLPNFPFKMGTKMNIKVTSMSKTKVYYKSTLGGKSWEGRMTRVKKK